MPVRLSSIELWRHSEWWDPSSRHQEEGEEEEHTSARSSLKMPRLMRTHIFDRSAFVSFTTRITSTISRIGTICNAQSHKHASRCSTRVLRFDKAVTEYGNLLVLEPEPKISNAFDGCLHVRLLECFDVDKTFQAIFRDY